MAVSMNSGVLVVGVLIGVWLRAPDFWNVLY